MMTKRDIFRYLTIAVLALCSNIVVSSCSDDDDDDNGSSRPADVADPLDTDEARTAWRWMCALTNATSLDQDWASKTYTPTVGEPSSNAPLTRIVVVSDITEAREHFANLADMEVSELTGERSVSQAGVGKLVWTPSANGAQNLAEVSVDVKIIPELQKIIYCTRDQVGENGLFSDNVKGTAYYRFGDVIRVDNYYWVCVRPSFAPDKGDSHWINIFNVTAAGQVNRRIYGIPDDNICSKYNKLKKYDNKTILLPTKLSYNRQHIYNLSNLIWALLKPEDYHLKVGENGKGLGGFDYKYHGEKFLRLVSKQWKLLSPPQLDYIMEYNLWKTIFGIDREEMQKLKDIGFFYQGYKWWTGEEATMWIYESNGYQFKYEGKESGDKKDINVVRNGFNINYYAGDNTSTFMAENNDPSKKMWVIRYKTGEQLSNDGKYSPYEQIHGCTDIYRYNEIYKQEVKSELQTEEDINNEETIETEPTEALDAPKVACMIGVDGKFYEDNLSANHYTGQDAVAMVVYIGQNPVETGTTYNALAIGFTIVEGVSWGNYKDCGIDYISTLKGMRSCLNGISITKKLQKGCDKNHTHPAAQSCENYCPAFSADIRSRLGFSDWFLPSTGQGILAMAGMGLEWDDEKGFDYNNHLDAINGIEVLALRKGISWDNNLKRNGWACTPYDDESAHEFSFRYQNLYDFGTRNYGPMNRYKDVAGFVHPFIAFTAK
ncbi:MAG: hypothetical protein K5683_08465 [Prevotella sp.]|nr:hypothetical protein [Prevotella sp.]